MGKKKTNPNKKPATMADVKKAKKMAQAEAVTIAIAIIFTVMRDKEGWGVKRLQRLWSEVNDLSDSVAQGYVTVSDLLTVLEEEAGIILK